MRIDNNVIKMVDCKEIKKRAPGANNIIKEDVMVKYGTRRNKTVMPTIQATISFSEKAAVQMGDPIALRVMIDSNRIYFKTVEDRASGFAVGRCGGKASMTNRKKITITLDEKVVPEGRYELYYSPLQDIYYIQK